MGLSLVPLAQVQGNCEVQDSILLLLPARGRSHVHGESGGNSSGGPSPSCEPVQEGRSCKALSLLILPSRQAGINGKEEHENAKAILLEMGEFFQIQVGGGSAPLGACQVLAVALRCSHCHTG